MKHYSRLFVFAFAAVTTSAIACEPGYVWRESTSDDHVCVTEQTRSKTRNDNRNQPLETCPRGLVWREATPKDHRCVDPDTRGQARQDNANAYLHAGVGAAPGAMRIEANGAFSRDYVTGPWSDWNEQDGVRSRFKWGLHVGSPKYAKQVDAIFEVQNKTTSDLKGRVSISACPWDSSNNTKHSDEEYIVPARSTKTISFLSDNCGTKSKPRIHGFFSRPTNID